MLSNEQAMELLKAEKVIIGSGSVDLSDERVRLELEAPALPDFSFIYDITLNKKVELKVSLHHQEHKSFTQLLRVDYRGRHFNPDEVTAFLPEIYKPYVGKVFGIDEPHIHRYVEGYKPLAWALPLDVYGFKQLDIRNNQDITNAITIFAAEINITSKLDIQTSLI